MYKRKDLSIYDYVKNKLKNNIEIINDRINNSKLHTVIKHHIFDSPVYEHLSNQNTIKINITTFIVIILIIFILVSYKS